MPRSDIKKYGSRKIEQVTSGETDLVADAITHRGKNRGISLCYMVIPARLTCQLEIYL